MSTQEDIYAAGSENHHPMLNKENYVPWSSTSLRYLKRIPNGKLIYNSIINEATDDELTEKELKQVEADDQAIQTILLGLPEDIYAAIDSCETTKEIWFTSTNRKSIESYYHRFLKLMNDFKRNKHFPEKISSNLKFLNNLQPEWSRHVTIIHQTKDLHTIDYTQLYDFLKYNQKEVDDLRAERLAKTYDSLALMANSNNPYSIHSFYPRTTHHQVQNPGVQNVRNQNGLIVVPGIGNQNPNGNGNVVAAQAEGNAIRNNADLDEIEEVNANCILMANLQQALTSGTQTNKAPFYDSDGSAEFLGTIRFGNDHVAAIIGFGDLQWLGAKGDIGFFIGYSIDSCAYIVYNRRTKKIMERMNVKFDELLVMAFKQSSSKPELQSMTSGQISSGLDLTYAPSTITTQQPTEGELDLLFEAMYDDHIGGQLPAAPRTVSAAQAPQVLQTPTTTITTTDTAPTPTNSSSQATNFPNTSQDVDELKTQQQHVYDINPRQLLSMFQAVL
ncbi:hypothetical protein Tco_0555960 [Tanacetum coccineum]